MKKKYYVVWEGREPGIYDNYEDALEQVDGYPGPKWKSYMSAEEAAIAYREGYKKEESLELGALLVAGNVRQQAKKGSADTRINSGLPTTLPDFNRFPEIDSDAWVVDASCMGNPGVMEYRGVELKTGRELFRVGPFQKATNNIGEFLAIVHALALMKREGVSRTIYSDSVSGMAWVRRRQIKTQLQPCAENRKVFELMARALHWLNTNDYNSKVLKWQTELWGEIPADFGRK